MQNLYLNQVCQSKLYRSKEFQNFAIKKSKE